MPLSEEEQRILQEIEAHLSATDPDLVQQVSETTIYRHGARQIRWFSLLFVVGFALLVGTFATSLVLGFVGFLVMLVAALQIALNLRRLGKAGIQSLTASFRGHGGLRGIVRRPGRSDDA
jgi:Protein of unknown function (DUF3040)